MCKHYQETAAQDGEPTQQHENINDLQATVETDVCIYERILGRAARICMNEASDLRACTARE